MQRKTLATIIAALFALPQAWASDVEQMDAEPVLSTTHQKAIGEARFVSTIASSASIALPAVEADTSRALREKRIATLKAGEPLQIGVGRDVDAAQQMIDGRRLAWQALPNGGHAARFSVGSAGAQALRIGVLATKASDDVPQNMRSELRDDVAQSRAAEFGNVTLRFQGSADESVFEMRGDSFDAAEINWSPVTAGDAMTVEIELAAGASPSEFTLHVPQVSHLDIHPALPDRGIREKIGESDFCENDIVCRGNAPSGFLSTANAVARMVFTKGASSYLCTGTLLNNNNTPKRATFWSANHCISTQTVANTLQTYWFYQATTCNGSTVNPNYRTLTGGAFLRYNSRSRDTLLLELKNAPPAGATYAGWSSAAIGSTGTAIEGIHHPAGDVTKYSLGNVITLSTFAGSLGPFYQVRWFDGVTEGGSSGSGLFTVTSTGGYQLRGGLYGGLSFCSAPNDPDVYSRFADVYTSVKPYLNP